MHKLTNNLLSISVNEMGAEMKSLINLKTNTEYLWNGDPQFWGRTSPILFPIVGALKNKTYTYKGKSYSLGQHGFARDMKFSLIDKTSNSLTFRLQSSEETKQSYPFDFSLEITYTLQDTTVIVHWKVLNTGVETMYFSIGGHPGFMCPLNNIGEQKDYFIDFHRPEPITIRKISEKGLATEVTAEIDLQQGLLPISEHLFDEDALVIENHQAQELSLVAADKKPYLTMTFDAPLFGIWSPAKMGAPFVCFEPWYGRCDSENSQGELLHKKWIQNLEPGKCFTSSYSILLH